MNENMNSGLLYFVAMFIQHAVKIQIYFFSRYIATTTYYSSCQQKTIRAVMTVHNVNVHRPVAYIRVPVVIEIAFGSLST